jgi:hypothetical protein
MSQADNSHSTSAPGTLAGTADCPTSLNTAHNQSLSAITRRCVTIGLLQLQRQSPLWDFLLPPQTSPENLVA